MNMEHKTAMWEIEQADAVIVGGGPAGLAAAVRLYENGITDILILEREKQLGGILRQCIHDGFGLARFKTTLSGPEYAQKFIDLANEKKIRYLTDATVLEISEDKVITAATPDGLETVESQSCDPGNGMSGSAPEGHLAYQESGQLECLQQELPRHI